MFPYKPLSQVSIPENAASLPGRAKQRTTSSSRCVMNARCASGLLLVWRRSLAKLMLDSLSHLRQVKRPGVHLHFLLDDLGQPLPHLADEVTLERHQ